MCTTRHGTDECARTSLRWSQLARQSLVTRLIYQHSTTAVDNSNLIDTCTANAACLPALTYSVAEIRYPGDTWTVEIWTVKTGLGLGFGLGLVMTVQFITVQILTAQIKTGNPETIVTSRIIAKHTKLTDSRYKNHPPSDVNVASDKLQIWRPGVSLDWTVTPDNALALFLFSFRPKIELLFSPVSVQPEGCISHLTTSAFRSHWHCQQSLTTQDAVHAASVHSNNTISVSH